MSDEEAPIGRVFRAPTKVKYIGSSASSASALPAVAVAARNESVGPSLRVPKVKAKATEPKPKATEPKPKAAGGPVLTIAEVDEETEASEQPKQSEQPEQPEQPEQLKAEEVQEAAAALDAFHKRLAGIGGSIKAEKPPADTPMLAEAAFKADAPLKAALQAKIPPEVAPSAFQPIQSTQFQDFMVQTYGQYSPYFKDIEKILAAGGVPPPKEIDRDACKRRDPNRVETFYYQKLVRDYMNRATPYRGLLVYHGLGTGKTCTSIAAAEALYWGGKRKIFVLTPATLSNNYRRELGKCGYFPLRKENDWTFLAYNASSPSTSFFMLEVMGLPKAFVEKQGGVWMPNPLKPSNWASLSAEVHTSILNQMRVHLNHRFKFIHYNGVLPAALADLAEEGFRAGESVFDNAVVIVDEIHNLARTINGTKIGSIPLPDFMNDVEPREPTWSLKYRQENPGFRYPRGYTLYRLLTNAVGAKIIALSATPMINYAQEFGILMNIVGGEQRMAELSLRRMSREPAAAAKLEAWALAHPAIDFFKLEARGTLSILTVTPVPYGYKKVVKEGVVQGFVGVPDGVAGPVAQSRERTMDRWAASLIAELEAAAILTGAPEEKPFLLVTGPLLYDGVKDFVPHFIDRATLDIKNRETLLKRTTGLISYYRGGSEELMPRTTRNEIVRVPFSDFGFAEYSKARMSEIESESKQDKGDEGGGATEKGKGKGRSKREMDLYAQATASRQTGFLTLSRAACNFVFPEGVERPVINKKQAAKMRGVEDEDEKNVDVDVHVEAAEVEEDAEADVAIADEVVAAPPPSDAVVAGIVGTLMAGLEAKAEEYLDKGLAQFSPKYVEILTRIRASPGPVLVYSNFKTLEGLGIFAAVLRAVPEKYLPLSISKNGAGEWEIPATLMDPARPRYIIYTGDQGADERRLLLQLYNADVSNLPPRLSEQCAELLAGAPDNRDGRICRVFMITQSGAEGISLFNTRQVHVMEPYWNNVRLQQVIGRAIRLCSHMNLEWDERTVDVFTYVSVFSEAQKAAGHQLMRADDAKTTDETIFEIALAKQKLADELMKVAQEAAIDCQIHYFEHGAVTHCFKYPAGGRPMFQYHPDIERDVRG